MFLNAHVAQLVERILGKDEVTSSTLVVGSVLENCQINDIYNLNKIEKEAPWRRKNLSVRSPM